MFRVKGADTPTRFSVATFGLPQKMFHKRFLDVRSRQKLCACLIDRRVPLELRTLDEVEKNGVLLPDQCRSDVPELQVVP